MTGTWMRRLVVASAASVALLGAPRQSQAIFHWLFPNCCGGGTTYANYAPAVVQPAPQVCSYMPQVSYRVAYLPTPVVAYQPVPSCNPCTGCATTAYRPVTSYAVQPRYVPYTTYRPVYSTPCCAAPSYAASTVSYPAASYVVPAAAPSCCGSTISSAETYGAAPSTYSSGTTVIRSEGSSSSVQPGTRLRSLPSNADAQPSLRGDAVTAPQSEAEESDSRVEPQSLRKGTATPRAETRYQGTIPNPIGEHGRTNTNLLPRRSDFGDRTTARPLYRTSTYRPLSTQTPAASVRDDGGEADWRPAR